MSARLKQLYKEKIVPKLKQEFGYRNVMAVPKLEKVVLNIGLGPGLKDPKFTEVAEKTLMRITGQKPLKTKAKKSISAFKIREGLVVGLKATLRGNRMYDFVDKLVNVTFPRVRDFRGLEIKGFDGNGNYSIGFKEHIVFPEIKSDEVEKIHGLEIAISTTAKKDEEALALLRYLGFPLKK